MWRHTLIYTRGVYYKLYGLKHIDKELELPVNPVARLLEYKRHFFEDIDSRHTDNIKV
jgi:hypothetical protein